MRLDVVLPAIAASLLAVFGDAVDAQQSSAPLTRVEAGLGVGTRVPSYGDEGLGPFVSGTLRLTPGPSGQAFLLGAGYGLVFIGYTDPEGVRYDSGMETVMLHLGLEWPVGDTRRFAIDGQWNPAISRVRRFGTWPAWAMGPSQWHSSVSTVSAGLRYALSGSRGPVVAVNLRTYLSLNPFVVAGGVNPWYVLGLTMRRR